VHLAANDLTGAPLIGAKLDFVDARGARFDYADLRFASLQGADLSGASFIGARLDETDLTGVALDGALMVKASLRCSTLTSVHRGSHVNFDSADLYGARMTDSKLLDGSFRQTILSNISVEDSDFARGYFEANNFAGAAFIDSRFGEVSMRFAKLDGVRLDHARMQGSDLTGASLTHGLFTELQLQRGRANGAAFDHSDLNFADFSGASMSRASFRRANLEHSTFASAYLSGSDFANATGLESAVGLKSAIEGVHVSGLDGVVLSNAAINVGSRSQSASFSSISVDCGTTKY